MQAAVLWSDGAPPPYADSRPLDVRTVDLEGPGRGEVLVRMAAAGLCHSDLSAIEGVRKRVLPAVPGHEGAGVVVEVSDGVQGLEPGDHVVTVFVASCRRCRDCLQGRPNLCAASWSSRANGSLPSGARRLSTSEQTLHHWSGVSTFAEYAVVDANSLVKVDPSIPLDVASTLGCAVVTGVGAVLNSAHVAPGDSVAVLGLGGVGLSAVMGAVVAGATRIIAIDVNPDKLEFAKSLGATHSLDARDPEIRQQVATITDGGVDFAFDMAGASTSTAQAYSLVKRGGSLVVAALPHAELTLPVPISDLVSSGRRIIGSYMGDSDPHRDIPRLADLYLAGRLPIDRLQSARLPLSEINEGFDRLRRGTAVRDVIVFS